MRLLLTRPAADAAPLAAVLEAMGHDVLLEPLLKVEDLAGAALPLDGAQAVLLTSANGARALGRRAPGLALPVLAVGDATARAATAAGLARVESADGDVAALAGLARARLDPGGGALVQVGASEVAGDLAGALGAAGFEVRRAVLYHARTAQALSAAARAALADGALDGVLLYSPRTAGTFVRLVQAAGLDKACGKLTMFALSPAVAGAAAALPWRRRLVAAAPRQDALLALIGPDDGADA